MDNIKEWSFMKIVKEKPKSTLGYEDATMRMKIIVWEKKVWLKWYLDCGAWFPNCVVWKCELEKIKQQEIIEWYYQSWVTTMIQLSYLRWGTTILHTSCWGVLPRGYPLPRTRGGLAVVQAVVGRVRRLPRIRKKKTWVGQTKMKVVLRPL